LFSLIFKYLFALFFARVVDLIAYCDV